MVLSTATATAAHLAWLKLRRQPRSVEFYEYTYGKLTAFLNATGAEQRLDKLVPAVADQYAVWLGERGLGKVSVHHCVSTLCALTRWAQREGYLRKNPLDGYVKPSASRRMVTGYRPEEVQSFIAACKKTATGRRDSALLLFAYDTGVRSTELAALTVGDVDVVRGTALIRHGKGDRSRMVVFSNVTAAALRKYLLADHRDGENPAAPLFPSQVGGHLTRNGVYQLTRRIAAAAGVTGRLGLHRLRHAMAETTLASGGNLRFVQDQLGHRDLSCLHRYTRWGEQTLRDMRERSSPVARLKGVK